MALPALDRVPNNGNEALNSDLMWFDIGSTWLGWFTSEIMPKLHDNMRKSEVQDLILDLANEIKKERCGHTEGS